MLLVLPKNTTSVFIWSLYFDPNWFYAAVAPIFHCAGQCTLLVKISLDSSKKKLFTFLDPSVISCNAKLDGVGPVDNRPSTDKLHHFVKN